MTDQTEVKMTPQEYFAGYPEATASDTFKWIDKHGFEHMTTLRTWTHGGLKKIVDEFVNAQLADGAKVERPIPPAPTAQVQDRDATGLPIVDGEGKPVMIGLPEGVKIYNVKQYFMDRPRMERTILVL